MAVNKFVINIEFWWKLWNLTQVVTVYQELQTKLSLLLKKFVTRHNTNFPFKYLLPGLNSQPATAHYFGLGEVYFWVSHSFHNVFWNYWSILKVWSLHASLLMSAAHVKRLLGLWVWELVTTWGLKYVIQRIRIVVCVTNLRPSLCIKLSLYPPQ